MNSMTGLDRIFLDSNILLYLVGKSADIKKQIVQNLISPEQFISTQVVVENVNVCLKKFNLNKPDAFSHGKNLLQNFNIILVDTDIIKNSFVLSERYQLSYWDSLIIASAPLNNCNILYSEDMQDGMVIEDTLTIKNPFK
jgi:predicted nucleic acid-binding protein